MRGCHPDAQGAQSPGRTLTRLEGESLPQGAGSRTQGVLLRGSLSSCSGFRPGRGLPAFSAAHAPLRVTITVSPRMHPGC